VSRENIFYRKGYKGQLCEDYSVKVAVYPPEDITTDFYTLLKTGILTIRKGYAWDFDSGALDMLKSKRASLIHDCLYQMMNYGFLSWGWKPAADFEYYKALIQDGFNRVWGDIRFKAVRRLGGRRGVTAHPLCSAPNKEAVNRDMSGAA